MADAPDLGSCAPGDPAPAAAHQGAVRLKPLVLTIFKQEREIGTFPNHALSDIRHCFDMLRRGRPVTISPDRVAEVERLLQEHTPALKSLRDIEEQLKRWKEEYLASWDADAYYNSHRVGSYTDWNKVPQFRLASTCYALSGLARSGESKLVLDIACGSGLSSQVFQGAGHFVIGTDLSSAMLEQHQGAGDVILADMGQPLPFRAGAFDAAFSVSAIHYLSRGDGDKPEQRMRAFFGTLCSSLAAPPSADIAGCGHTAGGCCVNGSEAAGAVEESRKRGAETQSPQPCESAKRLRAESDPDAICMAGAEDGSLEAAGSSACAQEQRGPHVAAAAACSGHQVCQEAPDSGIAVAQYYPENAADKARMLSAAEACGFVACPVVDNVHESASRRNFLALFKSGADPQRAPVPLCPLYEADKAACILSFESWARAGGLCDPMLPAEHRTWVVNEHAKYARKLMRSLNRIKTVAAAQDQAAGAGGTAESVPESAGNNRAGKKNSHAGKGAVSTVPQLTAAETRLAERLTAAFGAEASLDEVRADTAALLNLMHSSM